MRVLILALGLMMCTRTFQQMPPAPAGEPDDGDDAQDDSQQEHVVALPEPVPGQHIMQPTEPGTADASGGMKLVKEDRAATVKLAAAQTRSSTPEIEVPENANMPAGTGQQINKAAEQRGVDQEVHDDFVPQPCVVGGWKDCASKNAADAGGLYGAPSGEQQREDALAKEEEDAKAAEQEDRQPSKPAVSIYQPKLFKINLRVPNWEPLEMWVENGYSAKTIKTILEAKHGIRNTNLWFNQKQITDESQLQDAGVVEGSIVNVVVRCIK